MGKHRTEAAVGAERMTTGADVESAAKAAASSADGEAADTNETAAAEEIDPAEVLEEDLTALMQRLQEQEQVAAENHDKFLRTLAEFDNFRKRTRQEIDDARRAGTERLASDLLTVLDNFERALQHTEGETTNDAVREGILLIHKQLQNTLAKHGIEPIEAVGQPFDPQYHEAIMQVEPGPDHPPGTVAEELRKGYMINGRVLRASLVKVAGD
jgi:molecular chaperone GrpE